MLLILYGQKTQVYSYIGFYDLKTNQFNTTTYDYLAIFKEDLIELSEKYILLPMIDNCHKKLYVLFNIQTSIFEQTFPYLYRDWRSLQSYPFSFIKIIYFKLKK